MLSKSPLRRQTPGVYFEWLNRSATSIDLLRTDIAGIVGIAARGPLNTPIKVESWAQFTSIFGSHIPQGFLAHAVEGFFKNGGQTCWIVRAADPSQASYGITALEATDRAPALELRAATPGTWSRKLAVTVLPGGGGRFSLALRLPDGSQETWRNLTLQPPSVRLVNTHGKNALELVSVDPCTWIQKMNVIVITREAGRFALELRTVGEWHEPGCETYLSGEVLKRWDDLTLDRDDALYVEKVINSEPAYIVARVLDSGQGSERSTLRPGSLLFPTETRFAGSVLNDPQTGSRLLKVSGLAEAGKVPRADLRTQRTYLKGGKDGLNSLKLMHLTGEEAPQDMKWGLAALAAVDEVSILLMPDLLFKERVQTKQKTRPPRCDLPEPEVPVSLPAQGTEDEEYPPRFDDPEISRGQQAMVRQCELLKDRVAILDPPSASTNLDEIQTYRDSFDTRYAALYFPWINVQLPLNASQAQDPSSGTDLVRPVPPSGHIAGIYAGTDLSTGVHAPPANRVVQGAAQPTLGLDDLSHGILNTAAINVIRAVPGRDIRVLGARTLSSLPEWRYVNVRRLMIMIEESIEQATQWVVMENNHPDLWREIDRVVRSFLDGLWRRGMLDGGTAEEAYQVTCDETTNPPDSIALGRLVTEIGVQPPFPAEFVIVRIGKTQGGIEIEEGPGV